MRGNSASTRDRGELDQNQIAAYLPPGPPDGPSALNADVLLWLNQVERRFVKLERGTGARGIFTSVADLAEKIARHIRRFKRAPRTIRWDYTRGARRWGWTGRVGLYTLTEAEARRMPLQNQRNALA